MTDADGVAFVEVAREVYVLRYPVLDVNSTLVVGGEVAAVIDTLATDGQARELLAAVRAITDLPLVLVNTHHHFDHCYGNGVLAAASPGCGVWAHEATTTLLREHATLWQRQAYEDFLPTHPQLAADLSDVVVHPPDRSVHQESMMDIGGRTIELRHFGRAHTDGDLVVMVPDAAVLVAGDMVEQGAPPSFADSYPIDWPEALAAMLHLASAGAVVVPGHGGLVDVEFVRAQHGELTELSWLIREGHSANAPIEEVAAKARFEATVAGTAVSRGYAELAGRI